MKVLANITSVILMLALAGNEPARTAENTWTAVLRAEDIVVGQDLQKLSTRRRWQWKFNEGFEVAVRKTAISFQQSARKITWF